MLIFGLLKQGWEDIIVKQDQSDENQSEMKISLPSMPSLYIISFLFRACEEVHRVGGHVLDKKILHKLASRLLEKVVAYIIISMTVCICACTCISTMTVFYYTGNWNL